MKNIYFVSINITFGLDFEIPICANSDIIINKFILFDINIV